MMNSREQLEKALGKWQHLGSLSFSNGTVLIGHVPHVAKQAYLHEVYKPLSEEEIDDLQSSLPFPLSGDYRVLLGLMNGCRLFSNKLNIYGKQVVRRSGSREDVSYPLSLALENLTYPPEKPQSWLAIGSVTVKRDKFKVYHDSVTGRIYLTPRNSIEVVQEWSDLWTWLFCETESLSQQFDDNGRYIESSALH